MSLSRPHVDIDVTSFGAGYIDTPDEDKLRGGTAVEGSKNCFLINPSDSGEARLRKRPGHRLITPTALAERIEELFNFEREAVASELLLVADGELRVFDGVDTSTVIGSGFTAGRPVRGVAFKNNLHLCDGLVNLRYDGTDLLAVGFAKPTAAPALATAAGPGVTGDYEGFAVWYDAVTDHESSPSDVSAVVTFANQQRQWTKPAGAPPANVTHWRVYCRRVDTSEKNFFRIPTDALIGAATLTESASDTARIELGPAPSSNDVPPAFAILGEFKGHRIGVTENSSELWISKQFDAESQHPKDRFPAGGKGDQKPVRGIGKFGTRFLVQKPRVTYELVGDRLPFKIEHVGGSFGNVNQEAAIEVDGWWWAWDETRGPYRTDLTTWEALRDTKIEQVCASINRAFLSKIKVAHYADRNAIIWWVPVDTTGRLRYGLPFLYKLGVWLPPIIGLEYSAAVEFTTSAGELGTYVGDEWGRLFRLFDTENDGVPSGTVVAPITGATSGTITASSAAFYTTGSGLTGIRAAAVSPAGVWQWVRIQSNTGTVLTLDTVNGSPLSPVPTADGTWTVVVGGIEWDYLTPRHTGGKRTIGKEGWHVFVQAAVTATKHELVVEARYDRSLGYADAFAFTFPVSGLVWGVGLWGSATWGESGLLSWVKHRLGRSFFDIQLRMRNYYPNEPFEVTGYRITADWKVKRTPR